MASSNVVTHEMDGPPFNHHTKTNDTRDKFWEWAYNIHYRAADLIRRLFSILPCFTRVWTHRTLLHGCMTMIVPHVSDMSAPSTARTEFLCSTYHSAMQSSENRLHMKHLSADVAKFPMINTESQLVTSLRDQTDVMNQRRIERDMSPGYMRGEDTQCCNRR